MLTPIIEQNNFQQSAEDNWPEDEAMLESADFQKYVYSYEQANIAQETVNGLETYWQKVFPTLELYTRFVKAWNKEVPKYPMKIKQTDLFED